MLTPKEITSTSNNTYKYIKSLLSKKARTQEGKFIIEGKKSVEEAIGYYGIEVIAFTKKFFDENIGHSELFSQQCEYFLVKDELFSSLCDTKSPQGIVAVCKASQQALDIEGCAIKSGGNIGKEPKKLYIYCDGVSDPGNAGTIIRIADCVGADGVIFSPQSVDILSPKVIRATMGSFFHVAIYELGHEVIDKFIEVGFTVLATNLSDKSEVYTDTDLEGDTVIIMGNESHGVSAPLIQKAHKSIIIPIYGMAESLNVAVATGIVCYEIKRQHIKQHINKSIKNKL